MIRTNFDESNLILSPPPGMNEDTVGGSTFAFRGITEDNLPLVITCWKPTVDEIDAIVNGGRVWLVTISETQPPSIVTADNPFVDLVSE